MSPRELLWASVTVLAAGLYAVSNAPAWLTYLIVAVASSLRWRDARDARHNQEDDRG